MRGGKRTRGKEKLAATEISSLTRRTGGKDTGGSERAIGIQQCIFKAGTTGVVK
jgi:hypothetical protein